MTSCNRIVFSVRMSSILFFHDAALSHIADIKIHSNYDTGMNKMKKNMKITVNPHGDFHISHRYF